MSKIPVLIDDDIREDIDRSYLESRDLIREQKESGEWAKRMEKLFQTDEEFQFIFGDNWKKEKEKMINDAKKGS
jgi:predicted O-methyltransferase YrrM